MAIPPAVNSLLSLPSSSQSVLLAREPPTEREKEPRAETSELGPPLKKLVGLVSCVVPGVSVASCTKSRPFKGNWATSWEVMTWPRVGFVVATATASATTSTVEETEAGFSEKSSSRDSSTCSLMILGFGRLKAREFDMDGVHSDGQVVDDVVPGLIRFGITSDPRTLRGHRNGGSYNSRAGFIRNSSRETADGLTVARAGKTQSCEKGNDHEKNSLRHLSYPFFGTLNSS